MVSAWNIGHLQVGTCDLSYSTILSSSPDVSDLQNFVNVALATAAGGEDDLTHDKLSNLRTVGSGFEALIYKLPKYAGYADLTERCESLWKALQNNPKLPEKLVRADSHTLTQHYMGMRNIKVGRLWYRLARFILVSAEFPCTH